MNNHMQLKKIVYMTTLAAVSIVLGLIEIPWPLAGFLKLDFSEVAILISLLVLGGKSTFGVVLIRGLVRRLFRGFDPQGLIGEMLAVFASLSIILGYYVIKKILKKETKPYIMEIPVSFEKTPWYHYGLTILSITFSLTTILLFVNFFVTTPLYSSNLVHYHVFSFVKDSDMQAFFLKTTGNPLTVIAFFKYCFVLYVPFNLIKGILVTSIYLVLKPRIKYIMI